MTRIRYFTQATVDNLRENVAEHLDWYYAPQGSDFPGQLVADSWREARMEAEPLATQLTSGLKNDAANALIVYTTLRDLTPQQASDERFWTYVSHIDCADYISERWLGDQPANAERAARKARNHFFARDARALIRDHGVSRLWWLGCIAHEAHPDDPALFLEIVLHRQDVRSALIERPSVSMNNTVLQGIFRVMCDHWEGDRALFKRETFRDWMVRLNRRGGVVLLDALPAAPLDDLLRSEAEHALEAASNDDGQPES